MKNYLVQLIFDMHKSAEKVPHSKIAEGEFDPEYMMELEESGEKPMSHWFGMNKEQFPSSERLSEEQLKLMATELEKLWKAYSFYPDFPEGLPAKRRDELMRDYLDHLTQHWPVAGNTISGFAIMIRRNVRLVMNFVVARNLTHEVCLTGLWLLFSLLVTPIIKSKSQRK